MVSSASHLQANLLRPSYMVSSKTPKQNVENKRDPEISDEIFILIIARGSAIIFQIFLNNFLLPAVISNMSLNLLNKSKQSCFIYLFDDFNT